MAQFLLVRHGEPDYSFCDERGYIGHGRDLYTHYNKVILVCHGMVIRTITYAEKIAPGEIVECHYEAGQPEGVYPFF